MPKLKPGTIFPSAEEDATITAAALADSDVLPLSDEQWQSAKPLVKIGHPPSTQPLKVTTTIRFDAEVLAFLKATGPGWQTRVNEVLREYMCSLQK